MTVTPSTRNLWGVPAQTAGLDQLRKDLWVVNIATSSNSETVAIPASMGSNAPSLITSLQSTFPGLLDDVAADIVPLFPLSVTFPESRIGSEGYTGNDNLPFQLPTADEPLQGTRMVFRIENPQQGKISQIVRVLECWKNAARAGRSFDSGQAPLLQKINGTYTFPAFRFDVLVQLYAGASFLTSSEFSAKTPMLALAPAFSVLLKRSWCGLLQFSELDYTSNGEGITIATQLYPSAIITSPSTGELAGFQQLQSDGVSFAAQGATVT